MELGSTNPLALTAEKPADTCENSNREEITQALVGNTNAAKCGEKTVVEESKEENEIRLSLSAKKIEVNPVEDSNYKDGEQAEKLEELPCIKRKDEAENASLAAAKKMKVDPVEDSNYKDGEKAEKLEELPCIKSKDEAENTSIAAAKKMKFNPVEDSYYKGGEKAEKLEELTCIKSEDEAENTSIAANACEEISDTDKETEDKDVVGAERRENMGLVPADKKTDAMHYDMACTSKPIKNSSSEVELNPSQSCKDYLKVDALKLEMEAEGTGKSADQENAVSCSRTEDYVDARRNEDEVDKLEENQNVDQDRCASTKLVETKAGEKTDSCIKAPYDQGELKGHGDSVNSCTKNIFLKQTDHTDSNLKELTKQNSSDMQKDNNEYLKSILGPSESDTRERKIAGAQYQLSYGQTQHSGFVDKSNQHATKVGRLTALRHKTLDS